MNERNEDGSKFRRPVSLPGLELVRADYRNHCFPAHAHPEFVIGTIVGGAERLTVGNRQRTLVRGESLNLSPEEVHSNASVGEATLRYLVLYIPHEALRDALAAEGHAAEPWFDGPFSSCRQRHTLIEQAHHRLWAACDALEEQSVFQKLAIGLSAPKTPSTLQKTSQEHAKVRRAKDYLHAHFRDDVNLTTLADAVGLSPYHLLRVFKRQVGLSPAAYRNLLRVMAVRVQLLRGDPPAIAAHDAGFADQSHMSRAFKLVMGTTPSRYAAR